jgi:hypothetical protein
MGKRELLLIAGFVVLGTLIYFVTAPDRPSRGPGFSFGRFMEGVRREVRGNRAATEMTTNAVHVVPESVSELRMNIPNAQLTIIGEDRADIASEFWVWSNGYDEAEAKKLAAETLFKLEPAGASLSATITFPEPGSQRARLKLLVPRRLSVQCEPTGSKLEVSGVAAVEVESARGETTIRQIRGRVAATHRGGTFTVEDVGPARLNTRGSDVRVARVNGETILNIQAGDFHGAELAGPIEIEASGADLILEKLEKTRGAVRVNSVGGRVIVRGLRTEARIDGRDSEMDISIDRAAPIAIFSTQDRVQITPPPDGYEIDAVASNGRIILSDDLKKTFTVSEAAPPEKEERISGKVNGGGPILTVRVTRGDIRVASRVAEVESR